MVTLLSIQTSKESLTLIGYEKLSNVAMDIANW